MTTSLIATFTNQIPSEGGNPSASCDICGALITDWGIEYVDGVRTSAPRYNRDKHASWHEKIGF